MAIGPVIATRGMPLTGISRCAITWWSWRGAGPGMAIDGCGSCFVGRAGIAITSGIYRLYCEAGLTVRCRRRKRLSRAMPLLPRPLQKPNEEWAMDFISDGLASGQAIRALTVLDHFTRECVAIEVDTSLSGERVARVLGQAGATPGLAPAVAQREAVQYCNLPSEHHARIPDAPNNRGEVTTLNRVKDWTVREALS